MFNHSSTACSLALLLLAACSSADSTDSVTRLTSTGDYDKVADSDGDGWADDGYQAGCSGVLFRENDQCMVEHGLSNEADSEDWSEAEQDIAGSCWIDVAGGAYDQCCVDTPDDDSCVADRESEELCKDFYEGDTAEACYEATRAAFDACIEESGLPEEAFDGDDLSDEASDVWHQCALEEHEVYEECNPNGC